MMGAITISSSICFLINRGGKQYHAKRMISIWRKLLILKFRNLNGVSQAGR